MSTLGGSRGYNTSARVSAAPGAFIFIAAEDFGVAAPLLVNGDLAYNAGAGSLAMSTAHVKITYITKEGESLSSAEASVSVAASTGAVTVTPESFPAGVIGWRVYSSATTGAELLNAASNSTTQAQQSFTVNKLGGGTTTITGFPISDTSVQILIYGAGAAVPTVDNSGAQTALPLIAAGSFAAYSFKVPNTGSQWKVQKAVQFMRSAGNSDPAGIALTHADCTAPVYPGVNTMVAAGVYMVLNGYLFQATVGGTTATSFIGFSNFNTTKGAATTDGSVTWVSYGKATLVTLTFVNNGAGANAPVAQPYELFQN